MRARLISRHAPAFFGVLGLIFGLAGLAMSGCGKSATPTGPSSATGAPTIDAISPSTPVASPSPQTITFTGSDFLVGMTVDMKTPAGGAQTFGADALLNRQDTSFSIVTTLPDPGVYQFTVKNLDGQPSDPFSAMVQSTSTNPQISGVSPALPARNAQPQLLVVTGAQFAVGLSVTITRPNGSQIILVGGDISALSPASLQISITLATSGTYTIMVTNPTGESSNTLPFTVTPS